MRLSFLRRAGRSVARRRAVAVAVFVATPVLVGGFVVERGGSQAGLELFTQVRGLIARTFVDSLDDLTIQEKAARGLIKELRDPYAEFYTPKELESFTRNTNGRYGGVGMLIEQRPGTPVVARVYPNTPAEDAGVREGDHIIRVDTASTNDWPLAKVSNALLGTPGSSVNVQFQRPGVAEPITLRLTRRVIHIPAVPYAIMLDDSIGYLPVLTFNDNAASDVQAALERFEQQHARGVVLDLRDNGGGVVDQSLAMAGFFLPQGKELLTVRTRGEPVTRVIARDDPIAPSLPMAVLINGNTASASEIVAGALQDHDRALVVGTKSFGKGLVQSLYSLTGGYAMKLTTGRWYTPSGRSIHLPRTLTADGRLVETDTTTDSTRKARPVYHSDDGRVLYGGGAITPDVAVADDTVNTDERNLVRGLAPKLAAMVATVQDFALARRGKVGVNYVPSQATVDSLFARFAADSVTIAPADSAAARRVFTRELERRTVQASFGDSAVKRREVGEDTQLSRALRILEQARTQREVFAIADRKSGRQGL